MAESGWGSTSLPSISSTHTLSLSSSWRRTELEAELSFCPPMLSTVPPFSFKSTLKQVLGSGFGYDKSYAQLRVDLSRSDRLLSYSYTLIPSKFPWKSCLGNCLFLYLLSESIVLIKKDLTPWVLETPWKQHFWLIFPSLYKRDNKDSDCYCSFFVFLWDFNKIVFLLVLSSNRE